MIIGNVAGTKGKPNTPNVFNFWLPAGEETVQVGSIVKAVSKDREIFGIVEDMESYLDVDDFITHKLIHGSEVGLEPPNKLLSVTICKCRALKTDQERPITEGTVYYPGKKELEEIFNPEGSTIPFGVFLNTDSTTIPVMVDEDFVLGYEGAHVNISGMSGLGTKTSAFLFLLNSIFTHARDTVACVLFNIKSDDLLYLDEPSSELAERDLQLYDACQTQPGGFSADIFAPMGFLSLPSSLKKECRGFRWGYTEVRDYIPSLLTGGDSDQKEKLDTAFYDLKRMAEEAGITSLSEIKRFVDEEILREDVRGNELVKGSYKATWGKLYNQLKGMESKYGGFITEYSDEVVDLPYDDLEDRKVWVIDIQQMGFYPRKLIFEKVINELMKRLESRRLKVNKVILFMDELNKYAPSERQSQVESLKRKLGDVSARGRSIGMSLFSAQQFKSRVDPNITGNISTEIFGKTKEAELSQSIYKKLSDEIKGRIMRFDKDEKLLDHELFQAPVFIKIPRPPCMLGSEHMRKNIKGEGRQKVRNSLQNL